MIVQYHRMTGDELKRIYKLSGLKAEEFAAKVGLDARGKLYTQFERRNEHVDDEIERALKAVPELAQHQLLVDKKQVSAENQTNVGGPGLELLARSLDMINQTLTMVKDSLRIISDDNRFIKEDAEIYRAIVKEGMSKGAIKFVEPKHR